LSQDIDDDDDDDAEEDGDFAPEGPKLCYSLKLRSLTYNMT
jgi:hypothetical protein